MFFLVLQTLNCQAGPWMEDSYDSTFTEELLEKEFILQGNQIEYEVIYAFGHGRHCIEQINYFHQ